MGFILFSEAEAEDGPEKAYSGTVDVLGPSTQQKHHGRYEIKL
jgi:hypothetical protein